MDDVTCCCCGTTARFDDVMHLWFPDVFDGARPLGNLCDACADRVGLRDAAPGEFPHNERVIDGAAFRAIKDKKAN